jgi:AhpC/TSA family
MFLKEQLAEYRTGWYQRVPAERQAIMERHIEQLRSTVAQIMLKVGDRAPAIVLKNAKGTIVDVGTLLERGPVVVTFYRGGWCPYCNLELKAYQEILRRLQLRGLHSLQSARRSQTTRYQPRKRTPSPLKCSATWGRRWDEPSASSINSPKSSRAPTAGSIWISRPTTARRMNGRYQFRRHMLSIAMV